MGSGSGNGEKSKSRDPLSLFSSYHPLHDPFSPLPSLLVRKRDLCRGDRNTVVIFTETFLTPRNYNFSHIGNKVSL